MRTNQPTRSAPDPPYHPIPVERVVIEVVVDPTNPGARLVLQDGVESSYIDIEHPERLGFEYQRHLAGVVDTMHPRRLALRAFQIGGGPCAVVRYLDATRRDLQATVAEIDPGVVQVAERYLGLRQGPRIRVEVGDGRAVLETVADHTLDVLIVDAFIGLVVPHRLVTVEFVDLARRVLRDEGVHIVNLIDIPPHGYAKALVATLAGRYRHVVAMADEAFVEGDSAGNVVVAASDREIPSQVLARRAARDPEPWRILAGRPLDRWASQAASLEDDVEPQHELARLGDLFGRTRPAKKEESQ